MKKYLLGLSMILLMGGIVVGCSSTNNMTDNSEKSSATKVLKDSTKITTNEAVEIYQKTFPNTDVVSIELEKSLGKPVYTIIGGDKTTEYQLDINAVSKKIKQKSEEPLDEDDMNDSQTKKLDLDNVISLEKAARIAEKAAKDGQSTDFKLEKDDGIAIWEVRVKSDQSDKEIKINAQKGTIIKIENE
ncbi:lipoprotein [Companilactobacillus crustorum]|nr:PepSY domain-containing protein [Companilactobacillus crustorum]WDT65996.1 PepSY domain-containing protein [Companilactobacillus crustorum]GEO76440.1 lipoprotein [Companilactobacillus crustorum]HCD06697.1 hypothetical protein [Lactobacillus sp.]